MSVYIPVECETLESSTNAFFVLFRHKTNPNIGYELVFKKESNIRGISAIYEGTVQPAWYGSTGTCSTHLTSQAANAVNYFSLSSTLMRVWFTCDQDIRVDTLRIKHVNVAVGGTAKVIKNPGAGEVLLGTVNTTGITNYHAESTLVCSTSFGLNDIIEFRGETGTARIKAVMGYDSSTTLKPWGGVFAVANKQSIGAIDSTCEFAIALYLSSYSTTIARWIGGVAHQGSTVNMVEKSIVDVWTRDGSTWTVTRGFSTGDFELHRTSNVDWDGTTNIVATLNYTYSFKERSYGVSHLFTCSTNFTVANVYSAMLPASTLASFNMVTFFPMGHEYKFDSTGTKSCPAADVSNLKRIMLGETPLNNSWIQTISNLTHDPTSAFMTASTDKKKAYVSINPESTSGAQFGATWVAEFVSDRGLQGLTNETGGYLVNNNRR